MFRVVTCFLVFAVVRSTFWYQCSKHINSVDEYYNNCNENDLHRLFQQQVDMIKDNVTETTIDESVLKNVLVLTVASNETDGYKRFLRSADNQGISVTTLGLGKKWRGGSMMSTGGGQKINLLKTAVEQYKDDEDKIILFTDSYDVIYLGGLDRIVDEFRKLSARVVFSAETFCWPDKSLSGQYPSVSRGKQYLNSGGIIGYAPELYKILTHSKIDDKDDDQLYYTNIYLDDELRTKLNIKLDHKSNIFQNLNGAFDEVEVKFRNHVAYLENTVSKTTPLVLHGNGVSKNELNLFSNYLSNSWSSAEGCVACKDDNISLDKLKDEDYPRVVIAIFISKPTPFFAEFLHKISSLNYPKTKLDLFIYNKVDYHVSALNQFVEEFGKRYSSVKQIKPDDDVTETQARTLAVDHVTTKKSQYLLSVDSEAHLDNPHTLRLLIEQNRGVVAPMLVRPFKAWSNFWGALTDEGFYARSFDYMNIVNNEKRGLWNVPYVSGCYLVNATVIQNLETKPKFSNLNLDQDMSFCYHMRERGVFMYVSNRIDFGHLVNPETFDTTKVHPDFYQIYDNKWDWEQKYLHENYSENLNPDNKPLQPCPDVYWFPIASPTFCRHMIEIMEANGRWSDGTNKDDRINGGYEAVPTRDIHMTQVGLHDQWLYFLKSYVGPLNQKVYIGYQDEPPRAIMNFVVRYRPDEQPSLRPHHDSSTYTINIALNEADKDYEGGGCRFIRYNCSVTQTRMGWLLMHPGRLTHYHEGLLVTKGTRYIMISFVDP